MDDEHTRCRRRFTDWNNVEQQCSCECHEDNNVNKEQGPEEAPTRSRASRSSNKQKRKAHKDPQRGNKQTGFNTSNSEEGQPDLDEHGIGN